MRDWQESVLHRPPRPRLLAPVPPKSSRARLTGAFFLLEPHPFFGSHVASEAGYFALVMRRRLLDRNLAGESFVGELEVKVDAEL